LLPRGEGWSAAARSRCIGRSTDIEGRRVIVRDSEAGSHLEHLGRRRVMIVGSGWRFTSGISYYTCRLTNELSSRHAVSALLTRRLVPRWVYPGRRRVGVAVNAVDYRPDIPAEEVLDWYWGPNLFRVLRFLARGHPDVVLLQWWTGAVLHSYLLLAAVARRRGARVIIEWHEVQDTGEARIPGVTAYVRRLVGRLLAMCEGHIVHSPHDLEALRHAYDISGPVQVVPHGPYDHVRAEAGTATPRPRPDEREGGQQRTILYFGVVRPYKGAEHLVTAFDLLPDDIAAHVRLLLVGETWEGWTAHLDAVAASPRRDRITVRDEYVTDVEVSRLFAEADVVALPYLRSSSSGPLHLAMSAGLPVVVSDVGGLRAAAGDYAGAVFVRPGDPVDLADGLRTALTRCGTTYTDPRSWSDTLDALDALFDEVLPDQVPAGALR